MTFATQACSALMQALFRSCKCTLACELWWLDSFSRCPGSRANTPSIHPRFSAFSKGNSLFSHTSAYPT
ncbi:hypothetical protein Trisim1_001046 [Trichoderma cf. simile WF8]